MLRPIFFILCLLFTVAGRAQFQDDFNDADFPDDPAWFGDTDIYVVNTGNELQLMDVDAGNSFIYSPVNTVDSTTWEFYFRLEFNPSTTNQLRVYLQSDNADLSAGLNGYFLQIGASGSDDALELRRQDGNNSTILLSGTSGAVAVEPAVRVRVTRDNNANWEVFADYTGGTNFISEGSILDDTYAGGNFFGMRCNYSSTRRDKFFFDDISIGPVVEDETPPVFLAAVPEDGTTILLSFDEVLEQTSAENLANYTVDNGLNLLDAQLIASNQVALTVSPMLSGTTYSVTASGIADLNDNISGASTQSFTYYLIEPADELDIVFNEIFAKPDPDITNLPDGEFIELYNRSDKAFDLEGYVIADRSGSKTLTSYILPPQSYVIICDEDDVAAYNSFGNVLGVPALFTLNDADDDLSLLNAGGILIHEIQYTDDWYQDNGKADGGWTIEQINPLLACQGEENWRASNAPEGGTPGQQNSVFSDVPDTEAPVLLEAIAISENQLRIRFNEVMGGLLGFPAAYSISGVGNVVSVEPSPDGKQALLTIAAPFFTNENTYTLTIDPTATDCSGNEIGNGNTTDFIYYATEPAGLYDILINELLPDPTPALGLPEQEFIELYNRSDKAINLQGFALEDPEKLIELPFYILLPGEYVTLYKSEGANFGVFGDTLALPDFLGLGNDFDAVQLLNAEGEPIHALLYDKTWYQDVGKADGGWSLELINPEAPCGFATNWRASLNLSGGTPGRENSVLDLTPDEQSPDLLKVFPSSETILQLTFSEALDVETATNPDNYEIEGVDVLLATVIPPLNNGVLLVLSPAIMPGETYELRVKSGLTDCVGNPIGLYNSAQFAIPQTIEEGDIVINELLYEPETGGVRFVELYNRSAKVLNLYDLVLARRNIDDNVLERIEPVEVNYLLFPGEYAVLTISPSDITDRYVVEDPRAFVRTVIPTLDSREDILTIFIPEVLGGRIIDEFTYKSDYHNALVDDTKGVSLERINPAAPTNDPANWHSAAQSVGYATPTYENSQFFSTISETKDIFDLVNTTFSPDGDGFEDFLLINYESTESGQLANITIFDARGRLIKYLAQNELLANEGSIKWDGDNEEGFKARIGIYVVWIELFDADGNVTHFKKTCVLAGQLD